MLGFVGNRRDPAEKKSPALRIAGKIEHCVTLPKRGNHPSDLRDGEGQTQHASQSEQHPSRNPATPVRRDYFRLMAWRQVGDDPGSPIEVLSMEKAPARHVGAFPSRSPHGGIPEARTLPRPIYHCGKRLQLF
jgi:hypothetical protein